MAGERINGTAEYKIGELAGYLESLRKDMDEIKQDIAQIKRRLVFIDQMKGALNLTKWLIAVLGGGTVINLILWGFSNFKS